MIFKDLSEKTKKSKETNKEEIEKGKEEVDEKDPKTEISEEHKKMLKNLFPEFCFFSVPFLCFYVQKDIVSATELDFTVGNRFINFVLSILMILSVFHANGMIHQSVNLKNVFYYPQDDCFFLGDYNSVVKLEEVRKNSPSPRIKVVDYSDDLIALAFTCEKIKKSYPNAFLPSYFKHYFEKLVNDKNSTKHKDANDFLNFLKEDHKDFVLPPLPSFTIEFDGFSSAPIDNPSNTVHFLENKLLSSNVNKPPNSKKVKSKSNGFSSFSEHVDNPNLKKIQQEFVIIEEDK